MDALSAIGLPGPLGPPILKAMTSRALTFTRIGAATLPLPAAGEHAGVRVAAMAGLQRTPAHS
jgi:hypothetical protein